MNTEILKSKYFFCKFKLITYGEWSELEVYWMKESDYGISKSGVEVLRSATDIRDIDSCGYSCGITWSETLEWTMVKFSKLQVVKFLSSEFKPEITLTDGQNLQIKIEGQVVGYNIILTPQIGIN